MLHKPGRILSVSSNRVLSQTRNTVLAHAGYAVRPSSTVEATLAALAKQDFDLILIGHTLKYPQQKELIQRIRKLSKAPVLVVGHGVQEEVGANAYVEGIDGPERLLDTIAKLLAEN
jgi:DNA-binding response OmpR family regulator